MSVMSLKRKQSQSIRNGRESNDSAADHINSNRSWNHAAWNRMCYASIRYTEIADAIAATAPATAAGIATPSSILKRLCC